MPTEYRFDDIDLREEPVGPRSKAQETADTETTSHCSDHCTSTTCLC
ncbi:MAG: hypothetical protein QOI11_4003 [Candidatus Eremiobacteraeota bacterium]|jgi:hypothetical protein|nr:hypothetical protein [Candidatus Eremiobacteraeota bacterium]